jgi:6-phosphogluconolactonase (cycloisomerase 2 family)
LPLLNILRNSVAQRSVGCSPEAFRAEKSAAAASSYALVDGSLEPHTPSVGNGRSEICWAVVTPDDRFAFTTNFADGAVSRFAIAADGSLSLEDATAGIAVEGMPGLRDEDLSSDGRFLYAIDADDGRIYGWSVEPEGLLGAYELAERICAAFGCPHYEHLTIASLEVLGAFRASPEVKAALAGRIKST